MSSCNAVTNDLMLVKFVADSADSKDVDGIAAKAGDDKGCALFRVVSAGCDECAHIICTGLALHCWTI